MTPRIVSDALRNWLTEQLTARGLSDREASRKMGMGDTYLSQLIAGKRPDGRPVTLGKRGAKAIATYFDVSPDFIFDLEGRKEMPTGDAAMKAAMRDPQFKKLAEMWPRLKPPHHEFLVRSAAGLLQTES